MHNSGRGVFGFHNNGVSPLDLRLGRRSKEVGNLDFNTAGLVCNSLYEELYSILKSRIEAHGTESKKVQDIILEAVYKLYREKIRDEDFRGSDLNDSQQEHLLAIKADILHELKTNVRHAGEELSDEKQKSLFNIIDMAVEHVFSKVEKGSVVISDSQTSFYVQDIAKDNIPDRDQACLAQIQEAYSKFGPNSSSFSLEQARCLKSLAKQIGNSYIIAEIQRICGEKTRRDFIDSSQYGMRVAEEQPSSRFTPFAVNGGDKETPQSALDNNFCPSLPVIKNVKDVDIEAYIRLLSNEEIYLNKTDQEFINTLIGLRYNAPNSLISVFAKHGFMLKLNPSLKAKLQVNQLSEIDRFFSEIKLSIVFYKIMSVALNSKGEYLFLKFSNNHNKTDNSPLSSTIKEPNIENINLLYSQFFICESSPCDAESGLAFSISENRESLISLIKEFVNNPDGIFRFYSDDFKDAIVLLPSNNVEVEERPDCIAKTGSQSSRWRDIYS